MGSGMNVTCWRSTVDSWEQLWHPPVERVDLLATGFLHKQNRIVWSEGCPIPKSQDSGSTLNSFEAGYLFEPSAMNTYPVDSVIVLKVYVVVVSGPT
jgi:hypothetical protein